MYIVTNCTPQGNYTPVVTNTLKEAEVWMVECTANNIRNAFEDEYEELNEMSDADVLVWAKKNGEFYIYKDKTEIYYDDGAYNIMEIFEVEVGSPC